MQTERRQDPQQRAEGAIYRSERKATWPGVCSQGCWAPESKAPLSSAGQRSAEAKQSLCNLEKQGHGSRKVGSQAAHSDTPMQMELGINTCTDQLTALFSLNGGFRKLIWYRPGGFVPNKWYPHPMPTPYPPAKGQMGSLQHNLVSVPD